MQPSAHVMKFVFGLFYLLTLLLCEQPVTVDTCMPVDSVIGWWARMFIYSYSHETDFSAIDSLKN